MGPNEHGCQPVYERDRKLTGTKHRKHGGEQQQPIGRFHRVESSEQAGAENRRAERDAARIQE